VRAARVSAALPAPVLQIDAGLRRELRAGPRIPGRHDRILVYPQLPERGPRRRRVERGPVFRPRAGVLSAVLILSRPRRGAAAEAGLAERLGHPVALLPGSVRIDPGLGDGRVPVAYPVARRQGVLLQA